MNPNTLPTDLGGAIGAQPEPLSQSDAGPTPATLAPAAVIDSDHPAVREFAAAKAVGETDTQRAVALYYAVRDGFRYDPYGAELTVEGLKASRVITSGRGWCVPKAALMAAVCRAAGLPARVGFADVRNHLSTERMRQSMQTDVFFWHGFTEVWLDGAWRKATPAFNIELTDKFGLLPLEFDGVNDSIYHPFDREGRRHMEYLALRGSYDDVPVQTILADFRRHYPRWVDASNGRPEDQGDFDAEVARETAANASSDRKP